MAASAVPSGEHNYSSGDRDLHPVDISVLRAICHTLALNQAHHKVQNLRVQGMADLV